MKSGTALSKAYWILKYQGPADLWKRTRRFIKKRGLKGLWAYRSEAAAYRMWMKKEATEIKKVLEAASRDIAGFNYRPVISIIMPVWNTQAGFLDKAIQSVCNQAYPFWELCIADDASTEQHVAEILENYRHKDGRIKVISLSRQAGIAGAGNKAIGLATGDFTGFLDHDDVLAPHALLEVVRVLNQNPDADMIYTDEDRLTGAEVRAEPFFKPDWSPDLLMSMNYAGHLLVVRKSLLEIAGGFREGIDGSQDHDLVLRLSEMAANIVHIPQVLYHWRVTPGSVSNVEASRTGAVEAGRKAVEDALKRRGSDGTVTVIENGRYRVRYKLNEKPPVSIIIPTRDKGDLLGRCLESVLKKSTYDKYEIIVVDNGSRDAKTLAYLHDITNRPDKCRVITFNEPFNFSLINNFAAREAGGDYLLFLNNDTEVITSDWLEEMVSCAQRPEVGAVGAKLLFPDNRIQHGGVILGIGGVAGHAFYGLPDNSPGYMDFISVRRNCSAVTAACLMMRREVFERVGGFDEELDVAYNDVDLCLRVVEEGYYIVWTPHAVLYHHESASRGQVLPEHNIKYFCRKWQSAIEKGDPFYNRNLTLSHCDFRINVD